MFSLNDALWFDFSVMANHPTNPCDAIGCPGKTVTICIGKYVGPGCNCIYNGCHNVTAGGDCRQVDPCNAIKAQPNPNLPGYREINP